MLELDNDGNGSQTSTALQHVVKAESKDHFILDSLYSLVHKFKNKTQFETKSTFKRTH